MSLYLFLLEKLDVWSLEEHVIIQSDLLQTEGFWAVIPTSINSSSANGLKGWWVLVRWWMYPIIRKWLNISFLLGNLTISNSVGLWLRLLARGKYVGFNCTDLACFKRVWAFSWQMYWNLHNHNFLRRKIESHVFLQICSYFN